MSDTPRTDAVIYLVKGHSQEVVYAEFSRQLERELAKEKADNARLRVYNDQAEAAAAQHKSENARLREALALANG